MGPPVLYNLTLMRGGRGTPAPSFLGPALCSYRYMHVRSWGLLTNESCSSNSDIEVCMENPIKVEPLGGLWEQYGQG